MTDSAQEAERDAQVSEPVRQWEYRNFLCRIYRLGDIALLGYVRVGDTWVQVVEIDGPLDDRDVKTSQDRKVESEVDAIIRDAASDDDGAQFPVGDSPNPNPVDPNPGIDPIPGIGPDDDDEPFNTGPTWMYQSNSEIERLLDDAPVTVTGSASVKTTSGGRKKVNLSDVDVDDFTDDGLYKDGR